MSIIVYFEMISVIVTVWYEPMEHVLASLRSLNHQSYGGDYEIILVDGGLTPTQEISSLVDRVLFAPKGKLNARHIGILNSRGDIIVAGDADTLYPYDFLEKITGPFKDPEVVAVAGSTSWGLINDVLLYPLKVIRYGSRLSGRSSAFRKWAYFEVGGFDLTVDQSNWDVLMGEEEIRFYHKMKKLGKVVFVDTNVVHLGWGKKH